jgi:hypothetical protein
MLFLQKRYQIRHFQSVFLVVIGVALAAGGEFTSESVSLVRFISFLKQSNHPFSHTSKCFSDWNRVDGVGLFLVVAQIRIFGQVPHHAALSSHATAL